MPISKPRSRPRPQPGSARGDEKRKMRALAIKQGRADQAAGLEWRRNRKKIKGHPRCKTKWRKSA